MVTDRTIFFASIEWVLARILKPSPPTGKYFSMIYDMCVETNWVNEATQNSIVLGARCDGKSMINSAKLSYYEEDTMAYIINESSWKDHDDFAQRVRDQCGVLVKPSDLNFFVEQDGDQISTRFVRARVTLNQGGC
mmetsp:Transcript_15148/g.12861  ORF Transcript_15148/g.12861 Transcript_15148/m.12861 type:complete len:136 (+) Transcript_15148:1-408(+)